MTGPTRFPARTAKTRAFPIRLAAPSPSVIVEWATGVFYGNQAICPCCEPSEAEGFVVFLPAGRASPRWRELCEATEAEALAIIEEFQEWSNHRLQNLVFHPHEGNRYCWHRCSFDLELWPTSLAYPCMDNGRFQGWLTWPWSEGTGYDARPWGGE